MFPPSNDLFPFLDYYFSDLNFKMDNNNVRCQQNHGLTRPIEQDRDDLPHSGRGGAREVWNR